MYAVHRMLVALGCLVLMPIGFSQAQEGGKRDYRNVDSAEILRLAFTDWMTNPEVKVQPYSYLIDPDDRNDLRGKIALKRLLIDETSLPEGFKLKIEGIKVKRFDPAKRNLKKGEMSIRMLRFEPKEDGTMEIEFLHTGYGFIGGLFTTYKATQVENQWKVEFQHAFDP